jgi:hypothetical protein
LPFDYDVAGCLGAPNTFTNGTGNSIEFYVIPWEHVWNRDTLKKQRGLRIIAMTDPLFLQLYHRV